MKNTFNGLLEYISPEFIKAAIKLFKFLIIYTIGYLILVAGLKYAIPFVIAIIIAITLKPIKRRILKINNRLKRVKISNGFISFVLTATVVALILTVITIISYQVYIQMEKFLQYITNPVTVDEILKNIDIYISSALAELKNIDPNVTEKINEAIMEIIKVVSNLFTNLGKNLLNIAVSIPSAIVIVFITLISTFFFTKDIESIQRNLGKILSEKGHRLLDSIRGKLNNVFGGYVKAYILILLVVAMISYIIYTIAGVKYALPVAIITAILDFLPVIGAGLVYGAMIVYMLITGSKMAALILIIGFVIVAISRQLLEQNIVASFIGVHPLVMIIGLFIALTPLGFVGMFYFIGAFLLFQVVK